MAEAETLLQADGLAKRFALRRGVFGGTAGFVNAVSGIDLTLCEGETLGIVGESGCGKSTLIKLLLLLEPPSGGDFRFRGRPAAGFTAADLKSYRRHVQAVFQDPFASLSPRMRIDEIIGEPVLATTRVDRQALQARVREVMGLVGLDYESQHRLYPHQFSGGQRQRIAIARALAPSPRIILLDEPVSSLDVSIKAQILNLLADLQRDLKLTYLLISHDMSSILHLSTRIAVMYLGRFVEEMPVASLHGRFFHPYTEALLSAALPSLSGNAEEVVARGEVPSPIDPPSGCHFHPRCRYAMPVCAQQVPEHLTVAPNHSVDCHLYPARREPLSARRPALAHS
jgi:oligopeptide/dipeptide ABC transporter ATP-binding protein